ncbi:hypothetical protein V2J09_002212 [Rumex salicifolius]
MLRRRFLCSQASAQTWKKERWRIKQVTKTNFNQVLDEVKSHIYNADFIAVSLRNTGAFSAPWQKVLPIDTAETAYCKARHAAERFQIFQFAICPFTLRDSKLTAYPYNFHLFPRDELRLGVPSYSFSCQTSYLTSMARVGFDFNMCIYDGISYLSKEQESRALHQLGKAFLTADKIQPLSASSVGDTVFAERIKTRVASWRSACKVEDPLVRSLRKIVVGSDIYGSRPCLDIDVCSERQVQLAIEALKVVDDIVPLLVPQKNGDIQAIRIVLTSSNDDKTLFKEELKELEEKEKKSARGFREVIDLISASEKPVVAHNTLDDFTFIHSKFLGPLPATEYDFKQSLGSYLPQILDLSHLIKEVNPQNTLNNIPAALSYMRSRFFAPVSLSTDANEVKVHGHNVLQVSQLFAKLSYVLQQGTSKPEKDEKLCSSINHSNEDFPKEDTKVSSGKHKNNRNLSSEDLVFLWGFSNGHMSPRELKRLLIGSHEALFDEDLFDVKLVDKGCAVIAFWRLESARSFIESMDSGNFMSETLKEMVSQGLRVANYEVYKNVCKKGLWESDLADALDKADNCIVSEADSPRSAFEICWENDDLINLDDL